MLGDNTMLVDSVFDDKKFYLGKLCINGHEFESTGQSLRYKSQHRCVGCKKARDAQYKQDNKDKLKEWTKEYKSKHKDKMTYLGKLCQYGHEFENTGKSLRYYVKWQCVECKKISDKRYREQNEEKVKQRKKDYYEENKEVIAQKQKEYVTLNQEKIKERSKIYQQRYREKYPERNKERQKRYREKHKEKIDIKNKEYRKRTQPQHNENTRRYRAKKRNRSLDNISFDDIQARINQFNGKCAYCNKTLEGKRQSQIDHFIPLNKGGWHCLSNIVPACISCNSGKCDYDPVEWYKSKEFYSEKRLKKILKILGKDNYNQLTFL